MNAVKFIFMAEKLPMIGLSHIESVQIIRKLLPPPSQVNKRSKILLCFFLFLVSAMWRVTPFLC